MIICVVCPTSAKIEPTINPNSSPFSIFFSLHIEPTKKFTNYFLLPNTLQSINQSLAPLIPLTPHGAFVRKSLLRQGLGFCGFFERHADGGGCFGDVL
jgi:hypothetical protein